MGGIWGRLSGEWEFALLAAALICWKGWSGKSPVPAVLIHFDVYSADVSDVERKIVAKIASGRSKQSCNLHGTV